MGYYAFIDTEYAGDVSSNFGWFDFADWGEALDKNTYPELVRLCLEGLAEVGPLRRDLTAALKANPPADAGSIEVGEGLLEIMQPVTDDEAIILISDGTRPEGYEGDDDEDEDYEDDEDYEEEEYEEEEERL